MPSDANDLTGWLSGLSGWSVVLAVLAVIVGWLVSRAAARGTLTVLSRLRGISAATRQKIARVVRYAIVLLAVGIALTFLGAPVQPLLTAGLIVAVVLVLALRGISDNFAAGIVLQTRRPIEAGDLICVEDFLGVVQDINGRSVVLLTADGRRVHIPNSVALDSPLVNYSPARANRDEIEVRAMLEATDRDDLVRTIADTVAAVDGVDGDHPVQVLTVLDAPDRLTVRARFWRDPMDGPTVDSAVVVAVADDLRDRGIEAVVTSVLPNPPVSPPTEV
jgi:small-conductance mechanosensitive channel